MQIASQQLSTSIWSSEQVLARCIHSGVIYIHIVDRTLDVCELSPRENKERRVLKSHLGDILTFNS